MDAELFTPSRKKARVEIIPLIDVIFFLLATFVLFTLSLDRIQAIPAKLPVAPPGPITIDPSIVYLQATDGGMVYWKQGDRGTPELVSLAEVPAKLTAYKTAVAVPRVFVRGDNQAKFGSAVAVFDEVRRAGIEQVSIETMPSKTGQ